MGLFEGKTALVVGVANRGSIAWGIAQALRDEGARLGFCTPRPPSSAACGRSPRAPAPS